VRPPDGALEVDAGNERLWLLPERAAWWPRLRTLLVADAHLGKAAAFRRAGVPVPSGTTDANLARLSALIGRCEAHRVVFLGDLVHNGAARRAASAAFVRWRAAHPAVDVVLVRGNHDARAGAIDADWNVETVTDPLVEHGLALCHAPRAIAGAYAIAGHMHPAASLHGRGGEHLRLPCFWFTPDYAVLPAFGAFTGNADICATAGDRVYVAAGTRIVETRVPVPVTEDES
jgi:DNA ligase-associated metallophosphoesterase